MGVRQLFVVGICLVWSMVSQSLYAQARLGQLVFRSLDEDLGLSNSNVLSILRDNKGMMWYGTAYGLYRYDGTRVKAFFNSKDTTSISHNTINKLLIGPEEKLWVKNVNGIFDVYDPETGNFTRGSSKFTTQYHLASDTIGTIMKDRQGRFWFTHTEKGVSIFDPTTNQTKYLRAGSASGSLASDQIAGIAESPDGMIWAINQSGIIELIDPNRLIVTKTLRLPKSKIPESASYEIVMDSGGDAWIFDPERDLGVFWVDGLSHDILVCREDEGPLRLNNNMVKAVVEAQEGQIWLGTDHGGINLINKAERTIRFFDNDSDPESTMPHSVVYALYKDSEEIIWIGTHKKGISYYHQGLLRFSHVRKNFSDHNSLPFNDVNAFVEDSLGNLYIGTNGGGLIYHDRKAKAWEIAQDQIPDLVISDWMMPMMDGKELCQNIKGDIKTSHIPVILLTAKKSEENLLKGLDSGCNLYLTKPFNLEVLQLSVKNLLRERKVNQEHNRQKIQINASEVVVMSMDDQLIQKAVALVERHMQDEQLSVEFLSGEMGMSRVHLYKKLQSLTGKSPIEFIRLIRMQRAAQLLTRSQLNVAEVAYQVGYYNAKYFAKHFKAEFGTLPSEYAAKQVPVRSAQ